MLQKLIKYLRKAEPEGEWLLKRAIELSEGVSEVAMRDFKSLRLAKLRIIANSLVIPSFLGLGIQPPMSSWGTLIRYGVESMEEYSWLLIYPGLTFTITLFALNFFGDGLRDALDPKISSD